MGTFTLFNFLENVKERSTASGYMRLLSTTSLILLASMVVGCATPPPYIAHLDPQAAAMQRTDNLDEQKKRFGFFAEVVGRHFVGTEGTLSFRHYKGWLVPGASLAVDTTTCIQTFCRTSELIYQWNPNDGKLHVGYYEEVFGAKKLQWSEDAVAVRNGVVYNRFNLPTTYNPATRTIESRSFGDSGLVEVSREEFARRLVDANQAARTAQREKDRESSRENAELFGAIASGLQAAAQDPSLRNQQRAPAPYTAPGTTANRIASVTPPQRVQPAAAAAVTRPSSTTARPQARTENEANRGPAKRAYPEAIFVCTKPTGPKNSFECSSPVTRTRGHSEDISGHRSPDEMVNVSSSCPDNRRLPSSTHLVWGCGYAATNNSNTLDRSAGVDVQGRRTYYCSEKQTSCRQTQP